MNSKDDDNRIELDTIDFLATIEPEKTDAEEDSGLNRFIVKDISEASDLDDMDELEPADFPENDGSRKIILYSFLLVLFIMSVVFFTVGRAFLEHRALKYSAGISYRLNQNITAAYGRLEDAMLNVYRHSRDLSNRYGPLQRAVMDIDLSKNILGEYEKSVDNFLMYIDKNRAKFKEKNWVVFFELAAFYKSDTQRYYYRSIDAYLSSFRKMLIYHIENKEAIRGNLKPQSVDHYNLYMKYRKRFRILRISYKKHLDAMRGLIDRDPKQRFLLSYDEFPSWFWLESTLGGLK